MIDEKIKQLEDKILIQENTCTKILGFFILTASILNLFEAIVKIIVRGLSLISPMNQPYLEIFISIVKLLCILISFLFSLRKINKLYFHAPEIKKLIFVWGVILLPIQLIYELSSLMYTNMMNYIQVFLGINDSEIASMQYSWLYNSTHGFKYLGMLIAILLGVVVTGLILEDRKMLIISAVIAFLFMFAFLFVNMYTLKIDRINIAFGINWTSVIFHSLQTIGLFWMGLTVFRNFVRTEIILGRR